MAVHNTKSVRNTNIVMQRLKPYTGHVRLDTNAYYLNKKGYELIGSDKRFKDNNQAMHKIMRNDAFIYLQPEKWSIEQEFKYKDIFVRPDAYIYKNGYQFMEVDNTQRWHINVKKMRNYKRLKDTGVFQKQVNYFPVIIWVIKYESRKDKLKVLANELGLSIKVYMHDEIKI